MKQIFKLALLLIALNTTTLFAGPGHSHGGGGHHHEKITEKKAISIAKSMVKGLVEKGTIDKSWIKKDAEEVKQKKFGKSLEWVITFKNPELQDKSKETLYVFVNLYGRVTGVNYTGN